MKLPLSKEPKKGLRINALSGMGMMKPEKDIRKNLVEFK